MCTALYTCLHTRVRLYTGMYTAQMAQGKSISEAVIEAKQFIQAAIADGLDLGAGHGPTNHWAYGRRSETGRPENLQLPFLATAKST